MSPILQTTLLLVGSNLFMTFAWYGHLRTLADKPWYVAAILSWFIAFFEYMIMVPANRIGARQYSVAQLKILQEVVTLSVFVPFSLAYLKKPISQDFLFAGGCILGAVYFMFRKG